MADLKKQNHLLDSQANIENKLDSRIDRDLVRKASRLAKRMEKKNKGNS